MESDSETVFRDDLRKFSILVRGVFGFETRKSVSLGVGEALDIDPTYRFGTVLRLIEFDDRSGHEDAMTFVVRATADVDLTDDNLRYISPDSLRPFDRSIRQSRLQYALRSLGAISF